MTRSRDVADTQDNLGGAVAPFVGGKNFQINGGFDIWQRGTNISPATNNTYTADQWVMISDGVGTVNVTQQNIAAQGLNSTYAMRFEKSAGAANRVVMISVPEGALNCIGKTVTLSGYLRKGSGLTSNVGIAFGTRANRFGTVYDYANDITVNNASLNTSTFTKFSMSFNVTTATSTNNANLFEFEINYNQAGGANVYLDIAAIQIEIGSVATPFSRAGGSIGGELELCKRYYQRFTAPQLPASMAGGNAAITIAVTSMRTTPSVTTTITDGNYGGSNWVMVNLGVVLVSKVGTATIAFQVTGSTNIQQIVLQITGATWSGTPNGIQMLGTSIVEASAEL